MRRPARRGARVRPCLAKTQAERGVNTAGRWIFEVMRCGKAISLPKSVSCFKFIYGSRLRWLFNKIGRRNGRSRKSVVQGLAQEGRAGFAFIERRVHGSV